MKPSVPLTITSLLSILLITLHLSDDIARGFEKGRPAILLVVPVLVVWLYGTLVLTERRSGYVITLLGSLLGMVVPIVHFRAAGGVLGGKATEAKGAFFFIWSLIALGTTALFSVVLSARGLWHLKRGQ